MAGESNGWLETTVGEFIEEHGGEIKTGPFGTKLKASEYTETGVPVISVGEVGYGELRLHDRTPTVDRTVTDRMPEYVLEEGDIVFGRKGAVERSAIVRDKQAGWFLGSDGIRLRLPTNCDRKFIAYQFLARAHKSWMMQHALGTTMPSLNQKIIARIPIVIPPIDEQRAIASILGALDDKIELNRRMNATLESFARAIFKSWFVDFDPVRWKAEGGNQQAEKNASCFHLPPSTLKLFPSTFQDSELGKIPQGWEVDSIKNRAAGVQYGFTQSSTEEKIGPHFLRITDIRGGQVSWQTVPFCEASDDEIEKYRIYDGDMFVARTGASTGENIYIVDPPDAVFASYLVRFQFESRGFGRLVGQYMRTPDFFNHVAGSIGGSAQPNASAQTLAAATTVFPSENIANAFYELMRALDVKRAANARESLTLSALRDTLLPRLLSGELRVGDAAKEMETVKSEG